ncbi:hypothetical protein BCR43DRAFT_498395 [Syncephalastrum racemosum]|uniref:Putative lipoate-protein ligase A n=1 Tax=Syncephalastrum racemosum TaxID=13706 RepID=A0A1X2H0T1_SYNRA|nr:hypothetical protein BCR43DRAFT_498395 [Syncephalastrum racemosum]
MGNSIYTIFMPRTAFSREANAHLVSRALQQLDIPAYVNARHDIAVDGFKVSGSAYKIISQRAYHHGTMLLDADTDKLKGALSKAGRDLTGFVSKGIESVPSPVTNLRNYSYTIDHQQFCDAVLNEFVDTYHGMDGGIQPTVFSDQHNTPLPAFAEKTKNELQTWDWVYGQTPEFTNQMQHEFSWGSVSALIRSRHGVITEADLTTSAAGAHEVTVASAIGVALRGTRYSDTAVQEALQKINQEIPGLINPENEAIAEELTRWLQQGL